MSRSPARWLSAWRAALRIARRDALRAKARSALVVAMIALPVMAVVAVDVLVRTFEVTPDERITRSLGAADARAAVPYGVGSSVVQAPDADRFFPTDENVRPGIRRMTRAQVTAALPTGSRVISHRQGRVQFATEDGRATASVHEVELTDEMTAGLFPVLEGRVPAAAGEIVISPALQARGFTVGGTVRVGKDGDVRRIVGVVDDPQRVHDDVVIGPPGTLLGRGDVDAFSSGWLIDAPRPVQWSDVRAANQAGLLVLSRAVLLDPPPRSEVDAEFTRSYVDPATAAVVGLVIAMALLEVVLLAGPAFAVGTRRQRRQLALVAVAGGDRRHIRRVVLSSGVVLGGVGGVLGAVLGVAAAALARQPLQGLSDSAWGPVNVRLLEVGAVAALGALIGLLAALVPAILTSRQEVVAALQGRRGTLRSARRWPVLGLIVAAVGVALAIWGAVGRRDVPIIVGAIVTQLGLLVATPAVVGLAGAAAARMPLWLRFGARDAARHRSRSAPAVAAVMAAVAGSVALAIGGASDHAEQLAEYQPNLAAGNASVFLYDATAREREQVRGVLTSAFPDGTLVESRELVPPPGCGEQCFLGVTTYGCDDGASRTSRVCDEDHRRGVLVADTLALQTLIGDVPQAAEETLGSGGAVVFRPQHERGGQARLTLTQHQLRSGTSTELDSWSIPATVVPVRGTAPAYAVLSPEAAARTGLPTPLESLAVRTAALPSAELERQTNERLAALLPLDERPLYVERGYTQSMAMPFLILVAASALVTLGGTLVATGLAGADARADLATMAAVGAAPATRRRIAMSQAAVVAALGAGLGLVAGLVPGIAIAYPLTGQSPAAPGLDAVYVDVPWLVLGLLVVAVPALAVLTAGLFTRSRLPMVARAQ